MCVPILGLVGAVVSGVGALVQAQAQAQAYEAEAQLHKKEAADTRIAGGYEVAKTQREADRVAGSMRAAGAASGIDISTGSELDIGRDSAVEAEADIQAIRWNTRSRADTSVYKSQIAKMNAKSAQTAGVLGFITPIISGAAKLGGTFSPTSSTAGVKLN